MNTTNKKPVKKIKPRENILEKMDAAEEEKMTVSDDEAELTDYKTKLDVADIVFPIMTNGKVVGCERNTEALLKHYGIKVRYNEMTKDLEITVMGREFGYDTKRNAAIEYVRDCARIKRYPAADAESTLLLIGEKNSHHPGRDWVLSKKWDGEDRLHHVYDCLTHAEDFDVKLKEKLIRRWLIANIALIMHSTRFESDEHKERGFLGTEGVLVLQGNQGLSKTHFFQSLFPAKSQFFADGVALRPDDKDSVGQAVAHWVIELGELDSVFKKNDIAALRAWFTKKYDVFRPAYAKQVNDYPRRTGICASVNDPEFLPEVGENRRYWVIPVTEVHTLKDVDVQQVWAQAYHMYRANEIFWLRPEERSELYASNKRFERVSPIVEMMQTCVVNPYVDGGFEKGKLGEGLTLVKKGDRVIGEADGRIERLTASQIYQRVMGRQDVPKSERTEISKWLKDNKFLTGTGQTYKVLIKASWDPIERRIKEVGAKFK